MKDIHDECGVFGIVGHKDAATLTYLGLHALQHRGQESAGIAVAEGEELRVFKQMGLVTDVFTSDVLATLPGDRAIGHVRYSTAGSSTLLNAQPIRSNFLEGEIALAHNGNIVNANTLRRELMKRGHLFQSTTDSEVLMHLIADAEGAIEDRIGKMMRRAEGAYSLVLLTPSALYAVRDPYGFRPLVLGKLGDVSVVASETTALRLIDADYVREVEPGEVLTIRTDVPIESRFPVKAPRLARCVFEQIYFAKPDSIVFGSQVDSVRKKFGRQLARECPVEGAEVVIPVPDSGTPAAIGFAQEIGVPFEMGLIRSHYVGRTFIEPEQRIRHFGVKLKLAAVEDVLFGKVVVVVDDSIVRGTTSRKIVEMLRARGAKEVHFRVSSPPTVWPCYYGIDTPSRDELVAARVGSWEAVARELTADSVGYLSVAGMHKVASGGSGDGYCDACFTGNYPVPVEEGYAPHAKEKRN